METSQLRREVRLFKNNKRGNGIHRASFRKIKLVFASHTAEERERRKGKRAA